MFNFSFLYSASAASHSARNFGIIQNLLIFFLFMFKNFWEMEKQDFLSLSAWIQIHVNRRPYKARSGAKMFKFPKNKELFRVWCFYLRINADNQKKIELLYGGSSTFVAHKLKFTREVCIYFFVISAFQATTVTKIDK